MTGRAVRARAEVMATGLHVPEGPAVLPDGRILFTEQTAGRLSVFADATFAGDVSTGGAASTVATTGGSANSVVVGADGALYICQNGGVVGGWRSPDPRPPSIQRATLDGTVTVVTTAIGGIDLVAPNDLVFGPDGRLYLTDPAQPFNPAAKLDRGRLFVLDDSGGALLAEVGPVYCNGIGFGIDGRLLWVESYTRRVCVLDPDGVRRVLCTLPEGEIPDGLAVATDGRIFIASCGSHGVSVVGPDGGYLGLLALDERAVPSNCCFDGSTLWVTDFGVDRFGRPDAGRLWRVETDAVGAPVNYGAV